MSQTDLRQKLARSVTALAAVVTVLAMALSLLPLLDRWTARRQASALVQHARQSISSDQVNALASTGSSCQVVEPGKLLQLGVKTPLLSSWGNVGGCGVGGAGGASGGLKWVGRGVSGGLVSVQCASSHTFFLDGGYQTSLATRIGTSYFDKWSFAVNVPFRLNIQNVDVHGEDQTAYLPGWGDVGVEVARTLGITNAHSLSLSLNAPTGSADAVRVGVVLPQQMQLGSGTLSGGLTYEYNQDWDWGLMTYGLTFSYGGWENQLGDIRSSSISGYIYAGYIIGPFVPSLGLTYTSKLWGGDQERYFFIEDQPMVLGTANVGIEWATDWFALLLQANAPFAVDGLQSWGLALGVQTSFL